MDAAAVAVNNDVAVAAVVMAVVAVAATVAVVFAIVVAVAAVVAANDDAVVVVAAFAVADMVVKDAVPTILAVFVLVANNRVVAAIDGNDATSTTAVLLF